ncbi:MULTISPECIES: hypothetical protein [Bradyrhizobium]|uniref:hypothetical protein n=1 Tax=Bradyrhizobium TaxID=374 RepID=UPI001BA674D4|nr:MULTISPECIES: hypothetical protein [Bradyrhizobium]MBR0879667.1 hypothetical protein [Bradyrhizobium liaoningense]MCP1778778.1 hypothetical protein [Bradyrhizobium japonicum]MCP1958224.1 hypothetical protein [Bradyrhizobium japonicum]
METQNVVMDPREARELYRKYKTHVHWSCPLDREVMRAYQLIGQQKLVIKALESIVAAGLDADGHPKLAIAPADAKAVTCRIRADGSAIMDGRAPRSQSFKSNNDNKLISERSYIAWPRGSFANVPKEVWHAQAQVPSIPLHLKPKRGLANYHILWEAVWTKAPPLDPFLLRRIGKADLWVVVAMWELTEVERGALATRM